MKALITGAAGFIGSHVVERLLAEGDEVRCLVRPTTNRRWLRDAPVEFSVGDISSEADLVRATAGVDVVIHLAGITKTRDPSAYYAVNGDGTARLAEACLKHPTPPLFIYVSSQAAAGPCPPGGILSEDAPCHPVSAYGRSKLAGEQALAARAPHLPFVILRPSAIYGPRDNELLLFFKFIAAGVEPAIGWEDRRLNLCYVADLVDAITAAAKRPAAAGRTYFIAHDAVVSWREVAQTAAAALGVKTRRVTVPKAVVFGAALVAELAATLRGEAATLNREKAKELTQSRWVCDISRARRDLGFSPRVDLAAGVNATVAWYRQHGWL